MDIRTSFESKIAVRLDSIDQRQLQIYKDLLRLELPCILGLKYVVRRFLAAGANLEAQGAEALESTLSSFSEYAPRESSSMAILELLIDHGISVNSLTEIGSPLCSLTLSGLTEAVALLLRKGADPELGGIYGSPLIIAACGGQETRQVLELLIQHKVNFNRAYPDWIDPYQCGGDIDAPGHRFASGMTALHMCTASKYTPEVDVHLLVSYGARLEAKNAGDETPLALAVRCGRLTTTAALLAEGADTTGPSLLTKQDRMVYEADFQKALRLVQEAHSQRVARSRCSPTTLSHRTTNPD